MSNHDEISTLFARFIRNYQINNAEDARGPDYETRKYIYLLQQLRNKDSKVLVVDYEDLVDVADIYIEGKGISKYQAIIQMLKIKPDKAIKALSEGAFHVLQEVQPDYADDIGNDLRVAIRGVFYNIDISRISDEHVGRLVQISGIFTRPSPSTQYICSEGHNIRVKSKGSSDYGVKTGDYVSATGIIRMEKQANSLGKFYMQALWIEVKPEFYERHRNQLQLKCGDEGTSTYITWSQQDQKILQREYRKGATLRQLSELLMRDVNSVRDKIFNLGLKRKHEELVDKKRVGHLDVEASQLFGDFGFMLSWAIKEDAGEIIGDKLTAKDFEEKDKLNIDKRIIKSMADALGQFDVVTHYFGDYFDVPFVRTRCLKHGLKFLEYGNIMTVDVWKWCKRNLKLRSYRLESVAEHLGVNSKTKLDHDIWCRATLGDVDAINYIYEHNTKDTITLEKVYRILKPYSSGAKRSI